MDDQFAAGVDATHHDLEEAIGGVEPEAQSPEGAVVVQIGRLMVSPGSARQLGLVATHAL